MKPIVNIDDPRYVKALSHPLRVRILAMLQERTASPSQLSEWLGATLGTTAYHVRSLHQLGLIELADETRVRGAIEHHYRAGKRPMVSEDAWAQAPPIAKQAAVGSALQMVDEYARKSAAEGGFDRAEAHLSRTSMKLDAKGWEQLDKACLKFVEQAERIEAAAKERQQKRPHEEELGDAAVVLLAFEAERLSGKEPERKSKRGSRRPPRSAARS
jgi:DNA-binding transcriptional ArsR family regulator